MNTLHTPLCVLEPQVEAHAEDMFPVLCDPAIYQFEGVPPPSVERLAAGYRRRETRVSPDGQEQWLNWVVRRLPGGEATGYVQATVLPGGVSYVAYEFSSRFWRQGLGSASVRAMMAELAGHYGVHTFVAVLKQANFRSLGLLRHLGFAHATPEQAARYEAEPDEMVMIKPAADNPLLVTPEWLQAHLDDPWIRILDCTTWMTPQPVGPSTIRSGRPDWAREHIPGADHVCMVEDLSDPAGAYPYTLPGEAQIAALLSRLGISNAHHVVLYGAAQPMVVTRAWWVLSALGHPRVSILDGGLPRWRREGRPLTDAVTTRAPADFQARLDAAMVADAERVARAVDNLGERLVNALSPEQFAGTGGAHYGRPGRIPGSVNVPARDLVDPVTMDWLPPEVIAARLAAAGLGDPAERVITYCGGGIAASVTFFALRLLGRQQVALYDNSLLEWSADPARPMVR